MPQNAAFMQTVPMILIMLIFFYFLIWRPQQQQAKERKALLSALKTGDKVLTNGGIICLITGINGDELEAEIAKSVKVTIVRSAVAGLVNHTK